MKKIILLFLVLAAAIFLAGCKHSVPEPVINASTVKVVKGADVSWLSEMEASGLKFFDDKGTQGDCMAILKGKGVNAIRLRVWVNPADKWNNTADVVAKAKRA